MLRRRGAVRAGGLPAFHPRVWGSFFFSVILLVPMCSCLLRERGRDAREPGHVPLFCTIPGLTVGRAASLVMLQLGSLSCDSKGMDLLYLFGLVSRGESQLENAAMGSLFQRVEFLLGWC